MRKSVSRRWRQNTAERLPVDAGHVVVELDPIGKHPYMGACHDVRQGGVVLIGELDAARRREEMVEAMRATRPRWTTSSGSAEDDRAGGVPHQMDFRSSPQVPASFCKASTRRSPPRPERAERWAFSFISLQIGRTAGGPESFLDQRIAEVGEGPAGEARFGANLSRSMSAMDRECRSSTPGRAGSSRCR